MVGVGGFTYFALNIVAGIQHAISLQKLKRYLRTGL